MGAYAASKAGVHRLTEALAAELKGKITVNAVLPSIIDTAANRASMPKADFTKWVTPQELAEVILFLASDAASAVTGALIPVSGTGLALRLRQLPQHGLEADAAFAGERGGFRFRAVIVVGAGKADADFVAAEQRPLALARRMFAVDQFALPPAVGGWCRRRCSRRTRRRRGCGRHAAP